MKLWDMVYLKSGGPVMFVVKIEEEEAVCRWFDEREIFFEAKFPIVCLSEIRKVENYEGPQN